MYLKMVNQKGASIIAAIFLIIILSLMGSGMVSLLTTSQQSINQEVSSLKTYMAGRTCLQWAMYQAAFSPRPAVTFNPSPIIGTHTNSFTDTSSNLFNSNCSVEINVIYDKDNNDSRSLDFYNINVVAAFGDTNNPEYSRRSMKIQFVP